MTTAEEKEVLRMIMSGNGASIFELLYKDIFPKVKAMIFQSGGSLDEARDVFQDAVLIFFKQVKLNRYQHHTNIDAYLYRVSKNQWINYIKRKNKSTSLEESEEQREENTPELIFRQNEKQEKMAVAMKKIGERCAELLHKTVYLGMSMKEIVSAMGFSNENAAKTKNYKCKQRLIKVINGDSVLKEVLTID